MQLIIKPTSRCNFNCKFCSAANINGYHPSDGKVPEVLKDYISKLKPDSIIVTGGEPLVVPIDYYYELHEFSGCQLSLTTNLKDFYLHPEKWVDIMKQEWFRISTSFNYGDTRMWDENTVYSEEMFIDVEEKFSDYTGKPHPNFIAIIDDNNEDTVMKHIELAVKLNNQCRLNPAISCGRHYGKTYPRYKIFKHYIDIIEARLEKYEVNCLERVIYRCPRNIDQSCHNLIRCCYVDPNQKLHVSICDEQLSKGYEFDEDQIYYVDNKYDVYHNKDNCNEFIKPECTYCELFKMCNGCHTNRCDAKLDPNYCDEMKKLIPKLIETGWILN